MFTNKHPQQNQKLPIACLGGKKMFLKLTLFFATIFILSAIYYSSKKNTEIIIDGLKIKKVVASNSGNVFAILSVEGRTSQVVLLNVAQNTKTFIRRENCVFRDAAFMSKEELLLCGIEYDNDGTFTGVITKVNFNNNELTTLFKTNIEGNLLSIAYESITKKVFVGTERGNIISYDIGESDNTHSYFCGAMPLQIIVNKENSIIVVLNNGQMWLFQGNITRLATYRSVERSRRGESK